MYLTRIVSRRCVTASRYLQEAVLRPHAPRVYERGKRFCEQKNSSLIHDGHKTTKHHGLHIYDHLRGFHAASTVQLPSAQVAHNEVIEELDDLTIQAFITRCMVALGKSVDDGRTVETLTSRLKENWFTTVADLRQLSAEDASALQIPVRLVHEMRRQLGEYSPDAEAAIPAAVSPHVHQIAHDDYPSAPSALAEAEPTKPKPSAVDCAPKPPKGNLGCSQKHRVTKRPSRTTLPTYSLREEDVPPGLQKELDDFRRFLTVRFPGQQEPRVGAYTAAKYLVIARQVLGWLHYTEGIPLESLTFKQMVPSPEKEGVQVAFAHLQWLASERQVAPSTELTVVRVIIQVAKFQYWRQSESRPSEGDRPYQDIKAINGLRALANDTKAAMRVARPVADVQRKWLEWPEFLEACHHLKLECSPRTSTGRSRTETAKAWSMQTYLLFNILAWIPDRQRTLRELEVGRTLVKEGGRWIIRHGPEDYKTGRVYGERPPMVIAGHITEVLDEWLKERRRVFTPNHQFVFTRKNGTQMTADSVYRLFTSTCFRLTGKKTNPHLVRDMIITHIRSSKATEAQLEALAIYMGHSIEVQKSHYDRRTKAQKVAPAVELLNEVNNERTQRC